MLYFFLTLCLIGIFLSAFMVRTHQQRDLLQSRFNQIIGLRQLIHLLRFHRRRSHLALKHTPPSAESLSEAIAIKTLLHSLISQAENTNKPMYRILSKQLSTMLDEWPKYSTQRNQSTHGKAIRHVLYLIDDTLTQCLITCEKDELFKHYQGTWPVMLNAIDSLSRLRYAIENYEMGTDVMARELGLHAQILKRRMAQLHLPGDPAVPPLIIEKLFSHYDSIDVNGHDKELVKHQLYQFSLEASDTLFHLFDLVLGHIGAQLSIKLPELATREDKKVVQIIARH
ncbi:hypothetical protein C9J03_19670 [Photobacterium gaetbulicola]|uniref:Uncharacterized protein n=1 Tax=Photobacterium gaetbulicola Gung47 TaxID=658445 RepID=A0A0C5WWB8_9GAMM|nr:hypothetical protein [Photobacterium gaetbulicola]AJR09304.1 hypothetical protein H744_2c2648 [Photobacterium gaetbulicola Gung47]PSU03990.1 hypothetical protein C9J03_19670 [Photobacterium gaetbulicola]